MAKRIPYTGREVVSLPEVKPTATKMQKLENNTIAVVESLPAIIVVLLAIFSLIANIGSGD